MREEVSVWEEELGRSKAALAEKHPELAEDETLHLRTKASASVIDDKDRGGATARTSGSKPSPSAPSRAQKANQPTTVDRTSAGNPSANRESETEASEPEEAEEREPEVVDGFRGPVFGNGKQTVRVVAEHALQPVSDFTLAGLRALEKATKESRASHLVRADIFSIAVLTSEFEAPFLLTLNHAVKKLTHVNLIGADWQKWRS